MTRLRTAALLFLIVCITPLLTGCEESWDRFWGDYYLEGFWLVTEYDHRDRPLDEYEIHIDQHASSLDFVHAGRIIGYGRIFDDYISCDDWSGHGFNLIYIDTEERMHTPEGDHELVSRLELRKIR
jgi:hypothetical protein